MRCPFPLSCRARGRVRVRLHGGSRLRSAQVESPLAWRIDYPEAADVANTRWWEQFDDPVLSGLIDTALKGKPRPRHRGGASRRVHRPAQYDRDRSSIRRPATASTRAAIDQRGWRFAASARRGSVLLALPGRAGRAWQIDLFGRVRRQTESAQAQVYATEQGRRGVVLSLVTSVAASYIGLRALDRQLEISRDTAQNYGARSAFRYAPQGRRRLEARTRTSPVAIPAGARGDSRAPAADLRAGKPDRRAARAQALCDSARQDRSTQLVSPAIPAGLPSVAAGAPARYSRRPSRTDRRQREHRRSQGAVLSAAEPHRHLRVGERCVRQLSEWSRRGLVGAAGLVGPIFNAGSIAGQVRTAEADSARRSPIISRRS